MKSTGESFIETGSRCVCCKLTSTFLAANKRWDNKLCQIKSISIWCINNTLYYTCIPGVLYRCKVSTHSIVQRECIDHIQSQYLYTVDFTL